MEVEETDEDAAILVTANNSCMSGKVIRTNSAEPRDQSRADREVLLLLAADG